MEVRPADPSELPAVMTIIDNGYLEMAADGVSEAIDGGRVLVAVEDHRILGALVIDDDVPTPGARIDAVAVRPGRRGQGIGSRLVRAAAADYDRLVCEFDASVRPFWDGLGFEVERSHVPGRYTAWLDANGDGR